MRLGFHHWLDDGTVDAQRDVETPLEALELVAQYEGRQLELAIELVGGVSGVAPGVMDTRPETPDLWFDEGTRVTVEAVAANGFEFVSWSGALDGQANPATVVLTEPISAGASFTLTYAIPPISVDFPAAAPVDIQFEVDTGIDSVTWVWTAAGLPDALDLDPTGRLQGVAFELGSFDVQVIASDVRGLLVEGAITLVVGDPGISLAQLAAPFLLVGEALTPHQEDFLDHVGNRTGRYDLGDLRAWVLANPSLPFTANLSVQPSIGPRTIVLTPKPKGSVPGR